MPTVYQFLRINQRYRTDEASGVMLVTGNIAFVSFGYIVYRERKIVVSGISCQRQFPASVCS